MFHRIKFVARIALSILTLVVIAVAAQAGQRWFPGG
jgi:hypothetical protein